MKRKVILSFLWLIRWLIQYSHIFMFAICVRCDISDHSWLLFHTFHIGLEASREMKDCFAIVTSSSTLLVASSPTLLRWYSKALKQSHEPTNTMLVRRREQLCRRSFLARYEIAFAFRWRCARDQIEDLSDGLALPKIRCGQWTRRGNSLMRWEFSWWKVKTLELSNIHQSADIMIETCLSCLDLRDRTARINDQVVQWCSTISTNLVTTRIGKLWKNTQTFETAKLHCVYFK